MAIDRLPGEGRGDEVYSFLPLEDDYPAALWTQAVIGV